MSWSQRISGDKVAQSHCWVCWDLSMPGPVECHQKGWLKTYGHYLSCLRVCTQIGSKYCYTIWAVRWWWLILLTDTGSSVRIKLGDLTRTMSPSLSHLISMSPLDYRCHARTLTHTPDAVCAQACIPSSTRMLTHVADSSACVSSSSLLQPGPRAKKKKTGLGVLWWLSSLEGFNSSDISRGAMLEKHKKTTMHNLNARGQVVRASRWDTSASSDLITVLPFPLSLSGSPVSACDWGCGRGAFLGQAHSSRWDAFTKVWNSASHSAPLWCRDGEYQEILLGLRWCW